jgi:GNAT superfamily N-acetyltransferase
MKQQPAPTIRAATSADFDAWLPLWQGYQAFYAMTLPEATTALTWQRFLDPAEPMHLALAEITVDGAPRVVGLVHYIEHRSTGAPGGYVYLQDLYTASDVRGRGVGRALIEHVYAYARGKGAARVHWLTHRSNTQAMALYDQVAEQSEFVQYRKVL